MTVNEVNLPSNSVSDRHFDPDEYVIRTIQEESGRYKVLVSEFPDIALYADSEQDARDKARRVLTLAWNQAQKLDAPYQQPFKVVDELVQSIGAISDPVTLPSGTRALSPALSRLSLEWIARYIVESPVDTVVCLNNGGRFIRDYVSASHPNNELHFVSMETRSHRYRASGENDRWKYRWDPTEERLVDQLDPFISERKILAFDHSIRGDSVLVVDDIIRTGKTAEVATSYLRKQFSEVNVVSLAITDKAKQTLLESGVEVAHIISTKHDIALPWRKIPRETEDFCVGGPTHGVLRLPSKDLLAADAIQPDVRLSAE